MSWAAIVYGELKMTAQAEKKWRSLVVDPAEWSDWPEQLTIDDAEKQTVGATLDEIADCGEGVWLLLHRRGEVVQLTGYLHEDAYRDFATGLLAAVRAAARAGARGDVYTGDDQMIDFAWHVKVTRDGSSIAAMTPNEVSEVLPKAVDAVMREAEGRARGR